MTTPFFLLIVCISTFSAVVCALWAYTTVATRRDFVSPARGFGLGVNEGVGAGVIGIVFLSLLIILTQKTGQAPKSWQPLLLIWLGVPVLCGLGGGLGGLAAARQRLQPWRKQAVRISPRYFGPGSQHSFSWYLQQDSTVRAKSIGGLCRWLQLCRYVPDSERFQTLDYWQHPVEFEQTREGDCEDHALWAWRKLIELGYPAEIIVGTSYRHNRQGEYHAWVVFIRQQRSYLLEASVKHAPLITLLREVQHLYAPDFGVDQQLQTYAYHRRTNTGRA